MISLLGLLCQTDMTVKHCELLQKEVNGLTEELCNYELDFPTGSSCPPIRTISKNTLERELCLHQCISKTYSHYYVY